MNVTKGAIHDAMFALTQIVSRPRAIPQTGKFRISKLHSALLPFYEPIEDQRHELVQKHGSEEFADEAKTQSAGWTVKPGTPEIENYMKDWNAIRAERVELPASIQPLRLAALGDDPKGIEAAEFSLLGDFVVES